MRWANSFVANGEIELMSTTILPGVSPPTTPSAPKSASSTSGVSGTMRIITSAAAATVLGEAHSLPPPSSNALSFTPLRLCRNKVWPACCRLRAIGAPMIPRPIKPILLIGVYS